MIEALKDPRAISAVSSLKSSNANSGLHLSEWLSGQMAMQTTDAFIRMMDIVAKITKY